jgi:Transposase DDE domain
MDGRVVGRGGMALMLHVVYKGRALALVWRVRQSPKGHCPEDRHLAVVALGITVIPEGATVVFLGDGAFDGTALQATRNEAGWSYACRTAMRTVATWEGTTFRLETLGACSKPGPFIELQEVSCTRDAYGPSLVLCCWAKGSQEPLYVVSNLATAEEAGHFSQKRFRIETFFADQKSRGFDIHKSYRADPQRLSRLFIAACVAYIWMIY